MIRTAFHRRLFAVHLALTIVSVGGLWLWRGADAGAAFATAAAVLIVGGFAIVAWAERRTVPPTSDLEAALRRVMRGEPALADEETGSEALRDLARAVNDVARAADERLDDLSGSRNKVIAILGSMVDGVVAIDQDERVVYMNDVAGRVLDVPPEACLGQRLWEVSRFPRIAEVLDLARESGEEASAEVRLDGQEADGKEKIVELFASPLRGEGAEGTGAVVLLHDVTELRQLEGMRRTFVANVSHELKTPLTAIRGLVETLLDDADMPATTQRRFLTKIRDQADRLGTLVGDLLTLARVESQGADARGLAPLDLRHPAREGIGRFATICQQKGLDLSLELPDEPTLVRADEEAVRQIVDNLLSNAWKHTPEGGRIALSVSAQDVGGGREAVLSVTDTGIGIEPRHHERIFERFYRIDKARSRELGGTGLGLAIVKHLAMSLGGRIELESEPGRGSTFRVHLPHQGAA